MLLKRLKMCLFQGSVNLEVINSIDKPNMTYNTIVTKTDKHSVWETQLSYEVGLYHVNLKEYLAS